MTAAIVVPCFDEADRLDGAASYDEMMLTNVERAIEALGSG